jgi:hypothetical protein
MLFAFISNHRFIVINSIQCYFLLFKRKYIKKLLSNLKLLNPVIRVVAKIDEASVFHQ